MVIVEVVAYDDSIKECSVCHLSLIRPPSTSLTVISKHHVSNTATSQGTRIYDNTLQSGPDKCLVQYRSLVQSVGISKITSRQIVSSSVHIGQVPALSIPYIQCRCTTPLRFIPTSTPVHSGQVLVLFQ